MPQAKTVVTRVVFGAIMTAAACGLLVLDHMGLLAGEYLDGTILSLAMAVLLVLAAREIGKLSRAAGTDTLPVSATVGALLIGTMPFWRQLSMIAYDLDGLWIVPGLIVAIVFLEQMVRRRVEGAFGRVAATMLAIFYLGIGGAAMLTIRMDWGVGVLALFLAAVKGTDMGAYFTGALIGRHKLIPWLSPGKSWEGLIGGLAAAAGASVLVTWAFRELPQAFYLDLPLRKAAVFGVVVGLAGQFGDLCESLLKRSAQVKDSGALVPEFGGVLDVLDSLLIAAPAAYLVLKLMQ